MKKLTIALVLLFILYVAISVVHMLKLADPIILLGLMLLGTIIIVLNHKYSLED